MRNLRAAGIHPAFAAAPVLGLLGLLPTRVLAHPAHGDLFPPDSWMHYAFEPLHAPLGLGAAAIVLLLWRAHRRRGRDAARRAVS